VVTQAGLAAAAKPPIPLVVIVMIVTVVPIMVVAVIAVVVKVTIAATVPTVIVVYAAVVTFPVAFEKAVAVMVRPDPACPRIRRTGPIALMPAVVAVDRIPVSVNPDVIRTRCDRPRAKHSRRRWRADSNADGELSVSRPAEP